jgi:hypothetical protein
LPRNNPEKRSSQELKMLVELKPNFVRGFGKVVTWKGNKNMCQEIGYIDGKIAWVRVGNLNLNL